MPTTVRSHAKINLGLGIGAPRTDGFHGLATVYQTLEAHDLVTVEARRAAGTAIRLTSNERRVPLDGRNTAWKMVELALRALELSAEVSIHIEKRLPVQGGLGAGSANAVAALVGLEMELGIASSHPWRGETAPRMGHPLPGEFQNPRSESPDLGHPDFLSWGSERLRIAERVGSDVPLFLIGGSVLGLDRGQSVFPLPDLLAGAEPAWCVVATPAMGVSTPQAFRDWDGLCERAGLTAAASEAKLRELSRVYASAFSEANSFRGVEAWDGSSGVSSEGGDLAGPQVSALVRTGIANDFEQVVFPQHPLFSEIKRTLAAASAPEEALFASLSGSGSALFGLYRGRGDADAARLRLGAVGVDGFVTRTVPRREYWRRMVVGQEWEKADPSLRSG